MIRVEFKLSMPSNNSWNGKWSGAERNYTIVKSLPTKEVDRLIANRLEMKTPTCSWTYSFGDGWIARVEARIVPTGERLKKSNGFNGYDWMVTSILRYGRIYADHQRPVAAAGFSP